MKQSKIRRSGVKIMAMLVTLLGSLSYIIILAIINGSLGFLTAMGITFFGALGIIKALGEQVSLSYGLIIGLIIGCGILRGILRYFEQYSNHYIAFRLLAVLRDKIFKALRILCPAKLETKQKGNIIAMITSDIETLEVFYAHTISPIGIAFLTSLIVLLVVGFVSSWYLALVALFGYVLLGIISPLITSKRLKNTGVKYRQEFASFNAYYLDSIKGLKDIILNNQELKRLEEVDKKSQKLLTETKNLKKETTKSVATTELLISSIIVLSVIVGIMLVLKEELTFGKMILGIVAIFGSFGPVVALAALPGNLTQTFASGDRVLNLLKEKPVVNEVTNGNDFKYSNLEVNNLNFSYNESKEILKDINLKVNAGEIIGIVGESGSGKSTLLKLLLHFWQVSNNEIKYNNLDINNINNSSLLDNVTMVSQTTYLFDDTILNNLKIAKLDATLEKVKEACKQASIHDFIMSLPAGYDTKVGLLGNNLSAGEKQRIGLARAFLRGSKLILLDEPTSNVDSINEGIILSSLLKNKQDRSIILVSHRESTMAIADRIYKMEMGNLSEIRID